MANNNLYINYLNSLISKVYKILPMKEEQNTTTEAYISSLIFELHGFENLLNEYHNDARILTIICILESLKEPNISHGVYKSEVFKCISLIEQILRG